MTPFLTLAICTYDRVESLAAALATLEVPDGADAELLIVDNYGSAALVREIQRLRLSLPARIVREPQPGLGHARNRALAAARGHWIVFADDDVRFAPGFLAAWSESLTCAGAFTFAGGRLLPEWEGAPPRWFRGERLALLDGAMVWFDLGLQTRAFHVSDPMPFGANMAVRRYPAQMLGGFRADLGARGRNPRRGEETELFLRLREAGHAGLYVGSALARHVVSRERMRLKGLFAYGVASGRAHREIVDPQARGGYAASAAFLARGVWQSLWGRGDRLRQCVINAGVAAALAPHPRPFGEKA